MVSLAHTAIEEYNILKSNAGVLDRSDTTLFELEGRDAIDLLDRISTNKVSDLCEDDARGTILVNDKGKIVDVVNVLRTAGTTYLEVSAVTADSVKAWVEKFIITEDARFTQGGPTYSKCSLVGSKSVATLHALGLSEYHSYQTIMLKGEHVIVVKDPLSPREDGWNFYIPEQMGSIKKSTLNGIDTVATIHQQAYDIYRIERGIPAVGREITSEVNPLEAGLINLISMTKGCYLGQEVIARIHNYKKLQKKLTGFIFSSAMEGGAIVYQNDSRVGTVTSTCFSPSLEKWIGLGYIKTSLESLPFIARCGNKEVSAALYELPFVKTEHARS